MSAGSHLEKRILREAEGRKAAERLLEAKTLELFLKNEELQVSAEKLRCQVDLIGMIMDSVPDVVLTCNERLEIETVSVASLTILGYAPSDLTGLKITQLIPALTGNIKRLDRPRFTFSVIEVATREGGMVMAEIRGRRTRLHDRTLYVLVLHEIDERLATERMKEDIYRQLHESRRLEAIGALSSGIAHEMNTPIQFIGDNVKYIGHSLNKIHASYMLYDKLKIECQRQNILPEFVGEIDEFNRDIDLHDLTKEIFTAMRETMDGIKQVRDIVVLMKEFSHPGSGKPEFNDLNKVVQGALTISRSRTKGVVAVETDFAGDDPEVSCRKGQIQQVLVNLIVNAVEAIEDANIPDGRIRIATRRTDSAARIEVSDNGPGIPADVREQIFDPFFTTKQVGKGTGQGLALAKDIIIQQHGGQLYLDERPGYSTCFVIELPASPVPQGRSLEKKRHVSTR
ncbi:MAG: sensor histidine kinase [Rhodomicrobiaceae bacterium]